MSEVVDKVTCKVRGYATTHFLVFDIWSSSPEDIWDDSYFYFECNHCGTIIKRHKDYYDKNSYIWSKERGRVVTRTCYSKINENLKPKYRTEKKRKEVNTNDNIFDFIYSNIGYNDHHSKVH